jgi:hypothetical protein
MKRLIFDIETLPAGKDSLESLKFLYEKKLAKLRERGDEEIPLEDFLATTSFDGAFGRILCIAYAVNDEEVRVISNPDNEKKVLEDFWFVAGQCDLFVGHNIMDFDLRFILQRSVILGVKPSWNRFQELGKKPWEMMKYLSFARYQNLPIFDTMHEWSNWNNQNKATLEHLALALGIPTPKEGIDGSQVFAFFEAGKIKEICDYCKRDVEATRAVYKRMTFQEKLI